MQSWESLTIFIRIKPNNTTNQWIHSPQLPDILLRIFGIKKKKRLETGYKPHSSLHPSTHITTSISIHIPLHPSALFPHSPPYPSLSVSRQPHLKEPLARLLRRGRNRRSRSVACHARILSLVLRDRNDGWVGLCLLSLLTEHLLILCARRWGLDGRCRR